MIRNSILLWLLLNTILIADSNFAEWQEQEAEMFYAFQSNEDQAFMNYLKEWEWYQQGRTAPIYKEPKLVKQPKKEPLEEKKEDIIIHKVKPIIQKLPTIIEPTLNSGYQAIDIDFFGNSTKFKYDKTLIPNLTNISTKSISYFWKKITEQNYQTVVDRIKLYQDNYRLNGWATYLLIDKLSQKMSQEHNVQTLLKWFFLIKMGIDAKVGIGQNQVVLMVYSSHFIYSKKYFTINHKRYFILSSYPSNTKLQIYKGGNSTLVALNFMGQPRLEQNLKSRVLKFTFKKQPFNIDFYFNKNLIEFYRTYPQIPYNNYISISNQTKQTLTKTLQPIVDKMNQVDAINFLLRLTQNGFKYKRDHAQFGKEKVMFFEETLYYPYSDCEDRAIFFAILIEELLGLDTVFIKYPNHLATSIRLDQPIKGDKIRYKNCSYYIADPTYSNANIGQTMPQLKGVEFKIIETGS